MATAAVNTEYCNLSLQELRESPTNPRQRFEESALKELAESIKTQGVLSPILVRALPEGFPEHFEIVTGARRFRAAQLAGLDSIPVRIVNLSDTDVLEIQVIENLQRVEIRWKRRRASVHSCNWMVTIFTKLAPKLGSLPIMWQPG